jgi:hypothetical protein
MLLRKIWVYYRGVNWNSYSARYAAVYICILFVEKLPKFCLVHLTVEVSRSYTIIHTHPLGLLWTSDHLVADVVTCTTHNEHKRRTSMSLARFEPPIPAINRSQTYTLGHTDTGLGRFVCSSRRCRNLQIPRTSWTLQAASFNISWVNANSVSLHDNSSTRIWIFLLETLKTPFCNKILVFQSIDLLYDLSFNGLFLGTFAELWKAIIFLYMSVRLSARNNSAPTRRRSMKFDV